MANRTFWGLKASGILFQRASDRKVLLLLRSGTHNDGTWGIPGGKVDDGETPKASAAREVAEEVGEMPKGRFTGRSYSFKTKLDEDDYIQDERRGAKKGESFEYITYHYLVDDDAWEPELNWEHSNWRWFDMNDLPKKRLSMKDENGKTVYPVSLMLQKLGGK